MIGLKDNFLIFECNYDLVSILKHAERCGRICYKSENLITEDSYKGFIDKLIKDKHLSVLEHCTVYLLVPILDYYQTFEDLIEDGVLEGNYETNKYSIVKRMKIVNDTTNSISSYSSYLAISTNYRVIIENGWENDLQWITPNPVYGYHEQRVTVWISVDRGVGEEYLRHRNSSFSKESTRYCRYSNKKFGNHITTIIPETDFPDMPEAEYTLEGDTVIAREIDGDKILRVYEKGSVEYTYLKGQLECEKAYMDLLNIHKWTAQSARRSLSLATKGEFVMTAFLSDWQHVFDLRTHEITGKCHPDMKHIDDRIYQAFIDKGYPIK